MTDLDDRIRDSFRALTEQYGRSLPPPDGLLDGPGRHRRWLDHPGVRVVGIAMAVAVIVGIGSIIGSQVSNGPRKPAVESSPTPGQLAAGHWEPMPRAPLPSCEQTGSWDGSRLVVVDTHDRDSCSPRAATYDPATNTWAAIALPPAAAGSDPVSAWDGTRLVLGSASTGRTFAWQQRTDTWQALGTLPAGQGMQSLVWTGHAIVAATFQRTGHRLARPSRVYQLDGDYWTPLPDVPPPTKGVIGAVALGSVNGDLYAVVSDSVHHSKPNDTFTSGSTRTLRLGAAGWTETRQGSHLPESQLDILTVTDGLLVTGSSCPTATPCTEEDGAAALLIPDTGSIPITTPDGMPYPSDVTAGTNTVVVTFPPDSTGAPTTNNDPKPGTTWIYNITTARWQRGPTAPAATGGAGTYWTPDGVISLGGQTHSGYGGAILHPAK